MATKKPIKKFKRYDVGGPVDEATAKQRGLDASNKEAPVGFFERIRAGNIDDPSSEAYKRFGAGRGRATAATTTETKPQIVARIPPKPRELTPNEQSGYMQNLISSGSDIVGRPQNEGYRPNAGTASERAMLEGAFDSDKIIENTGPRTKPIVSPSKPTAPKPSAIKTESKIKSAPKAPAYLQRYTEEMMEADNPRSVKAEKVPAEKAKPAASPPSVPKASFSKVPTSEQASANRAAVAEKFKGMGSSVADYFSNFETPAKRKAREQKEKAAKGSYASGGSVSSASKRADGIATKGKTRGKMV